MKRYIVSYILLLFYLTIIIRPAIPVWDYFMNYDDIVENKCVNKDKPQMHCNGKCHLRKELKKVMDNENNPAKKKITLSNKIKEYTYYYRTGLLKKYYKIYRFKDETNLFITQKTFKGFLPSLIKPPPVFLLT